MDGPYIFNEFPSSLPVYGSKGKRVFSDIKQTRIKQITVHLTRSEDAKNVQVSWGATPHSS